MQGKKSSICRLASTADIPAMHQIRMSVRENILSNPSSISQDDYHEMLTQRGQGWVCEVGGQIIGFTVVDAIEQNVWALFVQPEYEGQGVGKVLHDTMLEWYFGTGATVIWLSTDPGTRAERFYQRAGWRFIEILPDGEARYEMTQQECIANQRYFTPMWIMIAGPYSSGAASEEQRQSNLIALNQAALEVFNKGHIPLIGVNLALPIIQVAGAEQYDGLMMPLSLALSERCDAVLRVGGASTGADAEVERIRKRGGIVFRSLEELPQVNKS